MSKNTNRAHQRQGPRTNTLNPFRIPLLSAKVDRMLKDRGCTLIIKWSPSGTSTEVSEPNGNVHAFHIWWKRIEKEKESRLLNDKIKLLKHRAIKRKITFPKELGKLKTMKELMVNIGLIEDQKIRDALSLNNKSYEVKYPCRKAKKEEK